MRRPTPRSATLLSRVNPAIPHIYGEIPDFTNITQRHLPPPSPNPWSNVPNHTAKLHSWYENCNPIVNRWCEPEQLHTLHRELSRLTMLMRLYVGPVKATLRSFAIIQNALDAQAQGICRRFPIHGHRLCLLRARGFCSQEGEIAKRRSRINEKDKVVPGSHEKQ